MASSRDITNRLLCSPLFLVYQSLMAETFTKALSIANHFALLSLSGTIHLSIELERRKHPTWRNGREDQRWIRKISGTTHGLSNLLASDMIFMNWDAHCCYVAYWDQMVKWSKIPRFQYSPVPKNAQNDMRTKHVVLIIVCLPLYSLSLLLVSGRDSGVCP